MRAPRKLPSRRAGEARDAAAAASWPGSAQVAALARTPEELAEALASVMSSVDRASHLLDQLLDLARVEAAAHDAPAAPRGRRGGCASCHASAGAMLWTGAGGQLLEGRGED